MAIRSLNQLQRLRFALLAARRFWLRSRYGLAMDPSSTISLSGRIVSGGRGSIAIGCDTLVAFRTLLISRASDGSCRPIRIGDRCFIGGNAVVLAGVTVGAESIVAAGAVVFDDVPPRCIVAGNPARVIRRDIEVGKRGRLKGSEDAERQLWR
ncbi:MAG: DapH/DapD/GlmU-related protein [Novosphingobium sp.]